MIEHKTVGICNILDASDHQMKAMKFGLIVAVLLQLMETIRKHNSQK